MFSTYDENHILSNSSTYSKENPFSSIVFIRYCLFYNMKYCISFIPFPAALMSLILVLAFNISSVHGQGACGTHSYRSGWLKKYQAQPQSYDTRSSVILYVPLSIHFVGNDNGSAFYGETQLQKALCTLNEDFLDSEIQFYIEGPIHYINSSKWNEHENVLQGAEMMFANNIENTLNNYIVSNPAGNCGYNLPYAGIALSQNCMDPSDHTWAHEIGHALSIPHPFLGWEGGVGHDGTIPHSYNDPAPEYVLYDYTYFKDTLILDTMIIDTAIVELLDGSNCSIAADGFCDTQADYLRSRWPCDTSTGLSNTEQTDPTGAKFYSDASLIMSYANDICASRFTSEQTAAMKANLIDEKPELLENQDFPGFLTDQQSAPEYPLDGQPVYYREIELDWSSAENAINYLVQVNLASGGFLTILDTIVDTDAVVLPLLDIDQEYFWRVMPFGHTEFCGDWSEEGSFVTSDVSDNSDIIFDEIQVFPNPSSQFIQIDLGDYRKLSSLKLYSLDGAMIEVIHSLKSSSISLDVSTYEHGIYLLDLIDEYGVHSSHRLLIMD